MAKLAIHEISQRPGGSWMVRVTLPGSDCTDFIKFPPGPNPPGYLAILEAAEVARKLRNDMAVIEQMPPITTPIKAVAQPLPEFIPWWARLLRWLAFWRR